MPLTTTQLAGAIGIVVVVASGYRWHAAGREEDSFAWGSLAALSFVAVSAGIVAELRSGVRIAAGHALWLLALPTSVAIVVRRNDRAEQDGRVIALAASLLVMPLVGAFGTNFNYWRASLLFGVFWVVAALVVPGVADPSEPERVQAVRASLLPAVLATVGLVVAGVMVYPYRQPAHVWTWDATATIGTAETRMRFNAPMAELLDDLQAEAQRAGLVAGAPVIDLTGGFPGLVNLMGAMPIGQAWTLGYYPGSDAFVTAGLAHESCDLVARAWVLHEQGGPRAISPSVLQSIGADFPDDYEAAREWHIPERTGVAQGPRIVQLFRPIRSQEDALRHCREFRD